jgi:hypothetical protein
MTRPDTTAASQHLLGSTARGRATQELRLCWLRQTSTSAVLACPRTLQGGCRCGERDPAKGGAATLD